MTRTCVADIFDELGPLEEHEQKEVNVEQNPVLEGMLQSFERILIEQPEVENLIDYYPPYNGGPDEIEQFSLRLHTYQHRDDFSNYAGEFLSMLISNATFCDCDHCNNFIIHTFHLDVLIDDFGFENENSRITIHGDIGKKLGWRMKGGSIHVRGNAGELAGRQMYGGSIRVDGNVNNMAGYFMIDGKLIVEGNAHNYLGADMSGGAITVKGNADMWLGEKMKGGTIFVNGDAGFGVGHFMLDGKIQLQGEYALSCAIAGGTMYHKDRIIVENGKPILEAQRLSYHLRKAGCL